METPELTAHGDIYLWCLRQTCHQVDTGSVCKRWSHRYSWCPTCTRREAGQTAPSPSATACLPWPLTSSTSHRGNICPSAERCVWGWIAKSPNTGSCNMTVIELRLQHKIWKKNAVEFVRAKIYSTNLQKY